MRYDVKVVATSFRYRLESLAYGGIEKGAFTAILHVQKYKHKRIPKSESRVNSLRKLCDFPLSRLALGDAYCS